MIYNRMIRGALWSHWLRLLLLLGIYVSVVHAAFRPVKPPSNNEDSIHSPVLPTIQMNNNNNSTIMKGPLRDNTAPSGAAVVENDFLKWCQQVLGIESTLKVATFDYYDYFQVRMQELEEEDDDETEKDSVEIYDDDAFYSPTVNDFPLIQVRGLAATKDIQVGDVVISIPFHAMITVSTTIDHDPVLSQLLGPTARASYGWNDVYYELPLLTVAILYHRQLGGASPMYRYIQILLTTPADTIPSLWRREQLRTKATPGVQRIARGIKRDVREMYNAVMKVLVTNHPNVFGNKQGEEWMYSFEMFQWGFAMVSSRHWHLPVPELNLAAASSEVKGPMPPSQQQQQQFVAPTTSSEIPPAEMPTEEWILEQEKVNKTKGGQNPTMQGGHSFMAPVADLLNFGPPCTKGSYNSESKRFELIATCPYTKGQEVTFWYSDDCDDVIIANYGFTHPMVPKCLSLKDWRKQSDLWRKHAEAMEKEVLSAYDELDKVDDELKRAQTVIEDCSCEKAARIQRRERRSHRRERHETGVRGRKRHESGSDDGERRKWQRSIKSSL